MDNPETRRRNRVVLPVLLIVAGLLVLLANLGFLGWARIWDLLSLWPVILIAIGVDLLTSGRSRWIVVIATAVVLALAMTGRVPWLGAGVGAGPATVHEVEIPLGNADRAEIDIRVGVSELAIAPLAGGRALVSGTVRTAEGEAFTQNADLRGDTAVVQLTSERRSGGDVRSNVDRRWELRVARDIPIDLEISTGVGRSTLDLRDLTLSELSVDAGVGETIASLPMPDGGSYQASFDTGVGATTVRVPERAAARIVIDRGLGSVSARGTFDALDGDTYQTPGYADADRRITIAIDGGVGSIAIERVR